MTDETKPPASDQPDRPDQADPTDQSDQTDQPDQAAELANIQAELAKANELHLRARADFANYQKRAERDRALASQSVKREFVKALLPALDALGLAVKHGDAEAGALLEGVKAARDAFEAALVSQGAERIKADGTWDPDLHHPQAAVERADLPDGSIIEEIRPGYKVGSLVARHSEVVVSKRPAEKAIEEKKPEATQEGAGA